MADRKIEISWNDKATVKPTPLGWSTWRDYYRGLQIDPPPRPKELRTELWNVAQIFGSKLYNGAPPVFETTRIEIERMGLEHLPQPIPADRIKTMWFQIAAWRQIFLVTGQLVYRDAAELLTTALDALAVETRRAGG
jgi:hypothetical protein